MALNVAVQMDPIAPIDIDADSTFALMHAAQARGHSLFYYTPDRLSQSSGAVLARGWPVEVRRERGNHFTLGEEAVRDLAAMDVVLLRQDPPFDMSYITTTHVLERIHPRTLVVNDPFWVRNCPEKILVADFAELTPETLITRDLAALRAFVEEHGGAIVKPLYGNGGVGVFKVGADAMNLNALHELFVDRWREPYIAQRFLPEVTAGDKRIILVDGEAAGVINRIPAKGETRSNMHVGGKAVKDSLTARDREICEAIGPTLRDRGLIFVGIDVIGGWLTEINVTSPTGIQELSRFDGIDVPAMIWDAIEARRDQA